MPEELSRRVGERESVRQPYGRVTRKPAVTDTATPSGESTGGDSDGNRAGSSGLRRLTDETELDAFVASESLALVELFTAGCSICASMEPVLHGVARTTPAAVAVCNPRDDPPLVSRFDVRSVPTMLLFRDGELLARRADGFVPTDELRAWIADATD